MKFLFFSSAIAVVITLSVGIWFYHQPRSGEIAGAQIAPTVTPIRGLIVPHHMGVAEPLMREGISRVAESGSYDRIVVLGVNHYHRDNPLAVAGLQMGGITIDTQTLSSWVEQYPFIKIDNQLVAQEHSLVWPMGELQQSFPDIKLIGLMISPFYTAAEIDQLSQAISQYIGDQGLVIVSVDFAHNLGMAEALDHNQSTIQFIQNRDYPALLHLTDEYLDGPVAVTIFLKTMDQLGSSQLDVWQSTHSSQLLGTFGLSGTSYVLAGMRK